FTFTTAGTYYFWAEYPGDNDNGSAKSDCASEVVIVDKNSPTLSTQVKNNAGGGNISNGGHVAIGTVAYDTAPLSSASNPTRHISFYVEKGDASCTIDANSTSLGAKAIGTNSDTFEF